MKNLSVVFALAFLLITAAAATAADNIDSNSHAQILTSIAITNEVPLEFGNIVASGSAGTVTVSPAGVRAALLGATLASGTTATAASFTVTGDADATYTATLPTLTTIDSGADSMDVDTYTSASTGSGVLLLGTDTLTVGAKVHVGISQAPGSYTGTFNVSVNYN